MSDAKVPRTLDPTSCAAQLTVYLREGRLTTSRSFLHGLVLKTTDPDEAAAYLGDSAVPYVSELLPGSPNFSTQIFVTPGQRLHLSRVMTSGALRVRATLPREAYAVVLDLRNGLGPHEIKGTVVPVGPEFAFVQSPFQTVEIRTQPRFEALFLRVSRSAVQQELGKLLGREPQSEVVFAPELRMATAAGRMFRAVCDELRRTLYITEENQVKDSADIRRIEGELITLLLEAQPHNYRRCLHRVKGAGAWQIRAAEEFMRSNAHLPISLGDVCQAAGVNARTLQDSFRKKRGCTPMEFLRQMRMEEVRSALTQPRPDTRVTHEAARWGFLHFGRFSKDYRVRFRELPSETLRRVRGREAKDDSSKQD